jgi:hypothetical protein
VGEELLVLTASITDGTFSHLGSTRGEKFLDHKEEIKWQFLNFCNCKYDRVISPLQCRTLVTVCTS